MIPPEIVRLTGITVEMVAGRRTDEAAVADLLNSIALVLADNVAFDHPFLARPAIIAPPSR
jgi:DNA polymerase-3 subunit epsilon